MISNRLLLAVTAGWLGVVGATTGEPASMSLADRLKDAPANTPVKIEESPTGGRTSPAFFWDPAMGRFVLVAGLPNGKRHYDVEQFDPTTGKWSNAYPSGSPYKVESGVTDAPLFGIPRDGKVTLADSNGVSRLPLEPGYYANRGVYMHQQYALDPQANRLYALFLNRLTACDLKDGTWRFAGSSETSAVLNLKCTAAWGVAGFSGPGCFIDDQVLQWGSFCWDPVNQEVLSVGGSSMDKGFTPGSWVYKTGANQWEKLKLGTPELAALQEKLDGLRRDSWALLSHCRSRFFITESPEEARARLSDRAVKFRDELAAFGKSVSTAKLPAFMKAGQTHATDHVGKCVDALGKLGPTLDGKLTPELLSDFQAAHRLLESSACDLDHEPRGRAHSRMVWDPVNRKIVLFGGDGLDRAYGDTWVYDPSVRTWEQKYPAVAPAPRGGHVLDWLPDAGRIVLAGGYSKGVPVPFDVWTYDVAANKWMNIQSVELKGRTSPGCPVSFRNLNVVGAVGAGDLMVMIENRKDGGVARDTWAMKVDPAKPAATAGDTNGVTPSTVAYVENLAPAFYEQKAKIEPEKMDAFFKGMPVNKWVRAPEAPVRPVKRDYGTCRYDPVRKQFLWWGGGHVNYWGTEVNHYSLRSGCWTASEQPDEPLEPCNGMSVKAGASFQGRPQIHTHAYQYYDYDPPSGLLVCAKAGWTYLYNPATRLWDSAAIRGGASAVRASPGGVFGALGDGGGIQRFDAKARRWAVLPASGDRIPGIKENYHGFCYDSKRDSVWYFNRDGVWQYDVKTGVCQRKTKKISEKQVKGYFEEIVFIPEMDKFLVDGRNFWDPAAGKWMGAEIPAVEADGSPAKRPPDLGATYGLAYDAESKLVLVNDAGSVWALKIDAASLKLEEIGE